MDFQFIQISKEKMVHIVLYIRKLASNIYKQNIVQKITFPIINKFINKR